eukprot:292322-Chlamydomonas_euryale.AAC.8
METCMLRDTRILSAATAQRMRSAPDSWQVIWGSDFMCGSGQLSSPNLSRMVSVLQRCASMSLNPGN